MLVEVFVEELARDAELRRAIAHRIAGEVATKRDLEELRRDLEARIDGIRKELEARIDAVEDRLRREVREVEARLHERIDKLNERIDRIGELVINVQAQLNDRIDRMTRWVIFFVAGTWVTLVATLITMLLAPV